VENGDKYTLNHTSKPIPINNYLSAQKRYRHLSEQDIATLQSGVDREWARLQRRAQAS